MSSAWSKTLAVLGMLAASAASASGTPVPTRPPFAPGTPSPADIAQRIETLRTQRAKLIDQCQTAIAQHDGAIKALEELAQPAAQETPK